MVLFPRMKTTAENPDKFLDEANAAYATPRNDPKESKEERAERALWGKTLTDGLEGE
jgi:hypothetical protein